MELSATDVVDGLILSDRAIQFVITKTLPYIFSSLGYGTWFFFACWMLIATLWAFFFLPETKGLTIDQMDKLLYIRSHPMLISNTKDPC